MTNHYTPEEDKVILNEVKNSPTNLLTAFRRAAEKIGRSIESVRHRYYKYLQKENNNKLFLTISSRKKSSNYKITRKGRRPTQYQPERTYVSKWRRILAILFE